MKIQIQQSRTDVIDEGLTVTTYANENYGHLHICGVAGDDARVVDISFGTFHSLPVIRAALARLYCPSIAGYHDDLTSLCALPRGHEGSHKSDHTGGEHGHFAHEWDEEDGRRISI